MRKSTTEKKVTQFRRQREIAKKVVLSTILDSEIIDNSWRNRHLKAEY